MKSCLKVRYWQQSNDISFKIYPMNQHVGPLKTHGEVLVDPLLDLFEWPVQMVSSMAEPNAWVHLKFIQDNMTIKDLHKSLICLTGACMPAADRVQWVPDGPWLIRNHHHPPGRNEVIVHCLLEQEAGVQMIDLDIKASTARTEGALRIAGKKEKKKKKHIEPLHHASLMQTGCYYTYFFISKLNRFAHFHLIKDLKKSRKLFSDASIHFHPFVCTVHYRLKGIHHSPKLSFYLGSMASFSHGQIISLYFILSCFISSCLISTYLLSLKLALPAPVLLLPISFHPNPTHPNPSIPILSHFISSHVILSYISVYEAT